MDDKTEPQKVFLVNPPSENPWRTRGDYLEEQRRATIQFRITIATVFISLVGVIVTAIVAIDAIRKTGVAQQPSQAGQLPKSKPFDVALVSKAESELKSHLEILKSGKNGVLRWGTIRRIEYEFKPGETDESIGASLAFEENFADATKTPPEPIFTKYVRQELEIAYIQSKWQIVGGYRRYLDPYGVTNTEAGWTRIDNGSGAGSALQLNMDYVPANK